MLMISPHGPATKVPGVGDGKESFFGRWLGQQVEGLETGQPRRSQGKANLVHEAEMILDTSKLTPTCNPGLEGGCGPIALDALTLRCYTGTHTI